MIYGKGKLGRAGKEAKTDHIIPLQVFPQDQLGEDDEDYECDNFLENFELVAVEDLEADAIGGDLKTILKKRDAPRDENHEPKRAVVEILEMTVPSAGHEGVGGDQEQDGLKQGR